MIFNKTNASSKVVTKGGGGSSSSSNNSSYSSNYSSESGDRYIWGEYDDGSNDINGNLYANGNLYVSSQGEIEYDEEDDGEEEDRNGTYDDEDNNTPSSTFNSGTLDEIFDTDNGNLYVEKKLRVDGDIASPEIYGKTTYIDYPELNNKKTDIKDLFKDFDGRITSNTTEINNLKTRVTQCEIDIDNLESKVITIEGNITTINNNITNINNEITEIKNSLGDVEGSAITEEQVRNIIKEMLPTARENQPVILYSGIISRSGTTSSNCKWYPIGSNEQYSDNFELVIEDVTNGLMKLHLKTTNNDYYDPYILAANVVQSKSDDTKNLTDTNITNRNSGAHWFEVRTQVYYIYIREFHNSNGDNDSWASNDWNEISGGINEIGITIIGYERKK